ncbi:hypothetical protein BIZ78_gp055 [Erwinia phage vB_EamM_Caitlin]|uniref:hypothetical protein n=1 Tax=Erwinia phage vB_EamM_Caitlin TaxID=1883379 RepID=UPI00081CF3EC|nr:hypothetical protein BIZ78_gp055 [Erwinia phage vB_EamM_Caitlin]ANZ48520.1 hypothetical protein CAITLIN_225 [Erwinia phage vB_EamM_Caitlin]
MKIAINLTPDGGEDLWKQLLGDLFTHYTPVVDKFIYNGKDSDVNYSAAVLLQMIDPLYSPLSDLSKALLVFVFDESDNHAGIIEANIEQFTLDNRVQDTLAAIRQGIFSSRVLIDDETLEAYDVEQRQAFYEHVENRVMELIKTLYDKAFGDVDEITFRFSKEKKHEGSLPPQS